MNVFFYLTVPNHIVVMIVDLELLIRSFIVSLSQQKPTPAVVASGVASTSTHTNTSSPTIATKSKCARPGSKKGKGRLRKAHSTTTVPDALTPDLTTTTAQLTTKTLQLTTTAAVTTTPTARKVLKPGRLFRPSAGSGSCRTFPGKQQKLPLADLLPVATTEPTSGLRELEDLNQMIEEEGLVEVMAGILEECGRKRETAADKGSGAEIEHTEEGQRPPKRSRRAYRAVRHPRLQTESMWAKPQGPK